MNQIKTRLFEVAPKILKEYPVSFAYLYGSYAQELEHPFSDLDICVYLDDIPSGRKLRVQMEIALRIDEELESGVDSEVRIMNDLPLIIKGQIVTEGLLIYSRGEALYVDFESYIRKAYFDFQPVVQQYQQIYLDRNLS